MLRVRRGRFLRPTSRGSTRARGWPYRTERQVGVVAVGAYGPGAKTLRPAVLAAAVSPRS